MGLRVSFTLSIYTACFLFFLLILHHKAQFATDWANLLLYSIISILHVFVYLYHLAFGFAWNLRPGFIYTAGLPGYCFFLAIMLFVPGFIFARLCSLVIALASSTGPGVWAVESLCSALPSPLTDELVLVALFSLLFTWSIIFHQAGLPALELVELNIDHARVHPTLCRLPVPHYPYNSEKLEKTKQGSPSSLGSAKTFTVGQISDPHLGLFMTAAQLRSVCEEVVALKPTFVFLTGDYFAAEVQREAYAGRQLKWALEPLASADGHVFACLGNHDYEGLPLIQATFKSLGIRLLCDESETIQADFGAVQVIGTHYVLAERRKADHLQKICAKFPATVAAHSEDQHDGADDERNTEATEGDAAVSTTRLMLVHDPKGFAAVDPDERVIAFAGHNHGGQIGLETFGIRWTLPRAVFPSFTDLGLWTKGRNYWYVHRGTGQHAFPFRWGVQREKSLLKVTISN